MIDDLETRDCCQGVGAHRAYCTEARREAMVRRLMEEGIHEAEAVAAFLAMVRRDDAS